MATLSNKDLDRAELKRRSTEYAGYIAAGAATCVGVLVFCMCGLGFRQDDPRLIFWLLFPFAPIAATVKPFTRRANRALEERLRKDGFTGPFHYAPMCEAAARLGTYADVVLHRFRLFQLITGYFAGYVVITSLALFWRALDLLQGG